MICETASCVWVGGCVESRAGWHGSKLVTKHHQHFRLHTLPAVMDFNGFANQYTHPQIKITFLLKKKKTLKVVSVGGIGCGKGLTFRLEHLRELVSWLSVVWNRFLALFFVMPFFFF